MALSVCLLILVGCAASVAADGYSREHLAYNYAPIIPAYGGLGLQSGLGGLLPIILIFVFLSIAAPALIGSLQSTRG
ncbi:uncharacterized protein LOC134233063 [Saccostrea cucullata]|uniref:uncharacterized protein LOC134233063 n=1 Tax=Saccostrea cuccullata TaxID=36930 RepID=UPI002ED55363